MKYLANGQAVEVLEETKTNKFVVKSVYRDEDSDETWSAGDTFIVDRIFDKAPVELFDADIEKREGKINALHAEERLLSTKIREMNREFDALVKRCEKYDALKNVFSFIDCKTTHYVLINWNEEIEIRDFKKSICQSEREERGDRFNIDKLRLLTLYGSSKGQLEWQLGVYSDHSGSKYLVYPCLSYDEALEKAKELIYLKLEQTKDNPSSTVFKNARTYGVEVPFEYENAINHQKIKYALENVNRQKAELKKAEDALLAFGVDMHFEEVSV